MRQIVNSAQGLFSCAAANGTYLSPVLNINTLTEFSNIVSFEFYDDAGLTIPSTGVTGTITVNGKDSKNGAWLNIPDSGVPSTVDASNPLFLVFTGPIYQLQVITSGMTSTNYINIIVDINPSSQGA